MNYLVTLKTAVYEQTICGVVLECAVGAADVKPDEDLEALFVRWKKVAVSVRQWVANGKLTGMQCETVGNHAQYSFNFSTTGFIS